MAEFAKSGNCFSCELKSSMFCLLTDIQLNEINSNRQQVTFKKGETIFKSGGPLTHILCITSGMVKIFLEDKNNKKNLLLKIAKPSQLIGGPGFLVDELHHITAIALEDTKTCFIKVSDFKEIMAENSKFAFEFIKYRNERVIFYFQRLMDLTHKQTHGKIADTLLYLANEVYASESFDTLLSRQDLADMSAMTKESVIRIIKEFVESGIIVCNNHHHFEILDKNKLIKISKTG
jgi:CRP/FNR family transcriptional regulator